MADSYTGAITFERNGKRERITLTRVPTFAALQTFASALYPLTTAGICTISFTQSADPELYEKTGELAEISYHLRAKLRQQNPLPGHDPDLKMLDLPAPDAANFDLIQEVGYRLKQAVGETIATAYSTLTGETWLFEEGYICGGG